MCVHRLHTMRAQRRRLSHSRSQNDDFRGTQIFFFEVINLIRKIVIFFSW